jgi:hypothetical protein
MRTLLAAALCAALFSLTGCSLSIDPESVSPPAEAQPVRPRGACVSAPGHKLCGGLISAGGGVVTSVGHVASGQVGAAPNVSSAQHRIVRGDVSP